MIEGRKGREGEGEGEGEGGPATSSGAEAAPPGASTKLLVEQELPQRPAPGTLQAARRSRGPPADPQAKFPQRIVCLRRFKAHQRAHGSPSQGKGATKPALLGPCARPSLARGASQASTCAACSTRTASAENTRTPRTTVTDTKLILTPSQAGARKPINSVWSSVASVRIRSLLSLGMPATRSHSQPEP